MAQRYTNPIALDRMKDGLCPECARAPEQHTGPMSDCTLTEHGVHERIMQWVLDQPDWPVP
jgi:hypothetical protein